MPRLLLISAVLHAVLLSLLVWHFGLHHGRITAPADPLTDVTLTYTLQAESASDRLHAYTGPLPARSESRRNERPSPALADFREGYHRRTATFVCAKKCVQFARTVPVRISPVAKFPAPRQQR